MQSDEQHIDLLNKSAISEKKNLKLQINLQTNGKQTNKPAKQTNKSTKQRNKLVIKTTQPTNKSAIQNW